MAALANSLPAPDPPWVTAAKKEHARKVSEGTDPERIMEYHSYGKPKINTPYGPKGAWCASFVSCMLEESGYESRKTVRAKEYLEYGRVSEAPVFGAVTIIQKVKADKKGKKQGHTGFLIGLGPDGVILLGGNQGDAVQPQYYPSSVWEVLGYRVPDGHYIFKEHYRLKTTIGVEAATSAASVQ